MSNSNRRSNSSASNARPAHRLRSRTSSAPSIGGTTSRSRVGQGRDPKRVGRLNIEGLGLSERTAKTPTTMAKPVRIALIVAIVAVVVLLVLWILSFTPLFTITSIEATPSEHLSAEDISTLAKVDQGTTLFSVDEGALEQRIAKNPWVKSVTVHRAFPDKLQITIEEHSIEAIVVMASGDVAWYLSDEGTWIEPAQLTTEGDQSLAEVALADGEANGYFLIQGVPSTVNPEAGAKATDGPIEAVLEYQKDFSEGLASQVASYEAASEASIACTLKSGLEISLGDPTSISSKEAVITELMGKYPNQLTYINVRIPSKPTYRKVDNGSVEAGSGVVSKDTQSQGSGTTDGGQGDTDGGQSTDGSSQEGTGSSGAQDGSTDGSGTTDGSTSGNTPSTSQGSA